MGGRKEQAGCREDAEGMQRHGRGARFETFQSLTCLIWGQLVEGQHELSGWMGLSLVYEYLTDVLRSCHVAFHCSKRVLAKRGALAARQPIAFAPWPDSLQQFVSLASCAMGKRQLAHSPSVGPSPQKRSRWPFFVASCDDVTVHFADWQHSAIACLLYDGVHTSPSRCCARGRTIWSSVSAWKQLRFQSRDTNAAAS